MKDYYYNYDPNMNLTFNDDVYYGNFRNETDLYNRVVREDNHRQQLRRQRQPVQQDQPVHQRQPVSVMKTKPTTSTVNSVGGGMSTMCILCLFIIAVLFFTIWRYGLLGYTIREGETLTSLALLTPEIGNAVYLAAL